MLKTLKLKDLGIDTYKESVVYMRYDCHICRAEGFDCAERVLVHCKGRTILATLNMVHDGLLAADEASLSRHAFSSLGALEGDPIHLSYPPPLASLSDVRAKIFHHKLDLSACERIIEDITKGRCTDTQTSAFLTACAAGGLAIDEITDLTRAMVGAGVYFNVGLGEEVTKGQPLFTLYAETKGELKFSLDWIRQEPDFITLEEQA